MNTMFALSVIPPRTVEVFEPDPRGLHSLAAAARLAGVPRHNVLVYCKHGLVATALDPERDGYFFDTEAIRHLRRLESLRQDHGVNLEGLKIIHNLMNQVEYLQTELRFLRA